MILKQIAKTLDEAALNAQAVPQMAAQNNITLSQAYEIQHLSISHRLARGEEIVGYKLGFTSKAKMEQMGVHDLIWGVLTDTMEIPANGHTSIHPFIHPRVEPEIAFKVAKDIDKVLTLENCLEYLEACAPAIEMIDSRYENFQFSLADVVADNCSSAAFCVGDWQKIPEKIDNLSMEMDFNGVLKQKGNSNAILENPLQSVVELSRLSLQAGMEVQKGQIILAGAATQAEYIEVGIEVEVKVEGLGLVSFRVDK